MTLISIWQNFSQPEYIHVLINPVPVYGLAMAWLGLLAAIIMRSGAGQVTALALVFISAASAWPVAYYGEAAEDRVTALADDDGQAWLAEHAHRADNLVYVFYALAIVSAAAIIAPRKWPKSGPALALATLILATAALGAGGYIAYAGGKIRHREFRNQPPPKKSVGEARRRRGNDNDQMPQLSLTQRRYSVEPCVTGNAIISGIS